MDSSKQEMISWILQYLHQEGFKQTVIKLEEESGVYLNLNTVEDLVTNGDYDRAVEYLSGFTTENDNPQSRKIYFEIGQQGYYEAVDSGDIAATSSKQEAKKCKKSCNEEAKKLARDELVQKLRILLRDNPLTRDKLKYHGTTKTRMGELIKQRFSGSKRKITEILDPLHRSFRLPDSSLPMQDFSNSPLQVNQLSYTNSSKTIVALTKNGIHKVWRLPEDVTAYMLPKLYSSKNGFTMTNDVTGINPEEAVSCFVLSRNGNYLISSSGGDVALYDMQTFERMKVVLTRPHAATSLALHPEDDNIGAIGLEDSSVLICKFGSHPTEVQVTLEGHKRRVTGLAFSPSILVSSGADAQLCVWNIDGWTKKMSKLIRIPYGRTLKQRADTRIQFAKDWTRLLVAHESHIAIYSAQNLECIEQWVPDELSGSVTDSTYSCDCQSIYTSCDGGTIFIFTSELELKCKINRASYASVHRRSLSKLHTLAIAAHPTEAKQIAIGLNNGTVFVLEPPEVGGEWGTDLVKDKGITLSKKNIPEKEKGASKRNALSSNQ